MTGTVAPFPFHEVAIATVRTTPEELFAHLDDQTRLASHMGKPSMMMMGGRMGYSFDQDRGQAIGSVIRMDGSVLGLTLAVEEVVTERIPPRRKVWATTGTPRLLIIGAYRMGFEIEAARESSRLRVFIDYALPAGALGSLAGRALSGVYARWCVQRMAKDATAQFDQSVHRA